MDTAERQNTAKYIMVYSICFAEEDIVRVVRPHDLQKEEKGRAGGDNAVVV